MPSAYEDAVDELHRAPLEAFVAERKRLAAGLTAAGDREGAARLAKLPRPTVVAWVVNQLFWRHREAFDRLLAAAERMRLGHVDAAATSAHRDALADLRARAAELLADAGKAGAATLQRVTVTLSALAAAGGFQPDPPGALQRERDPLGFDVPGLKPPVPVPAAPPAAPGPDAAAPPPEPASDEEERRRMVERNRRAAERQRIARELRVAQGQLEAAAAAVLRLEQALARATDTVERSRSAVHDLEAQLTALADDGV